jgi:hypothetical protein
METLNLTFGQHDTREDGLCLMEAVASLGGEEHSDQPECACPVLAAFGRALNDRMGNGPEGDALRAKYLAPLASKLVETRSTPEAEKKRGFFFTDRAVRLFAPRALGWAGLQAEAERLRSLPEIVDRGTAWSAADAAADAADAAECSAYAAARAGASAAYAVAAAAYAADAAAHAEAWAQAAKVLIEACEITEGGET